MRKHLGITLCAVLSAVACGGDKTPTEPAPAFTPPSVVVTPTPSPTPWSILGVTPRVIPYDVSTELSIYGSGFTFPVQVLLRSGGSVLELSSVSLAFGNTVKATAHVYNPPGATPFPSGPASLEVFSPTTGQRAVCVGCVSLSP